MNSRRTVKGMIAAGFATAALVLGGCGGPAGPIFEPLAQPLVWPAPPDPARIRYVGQIETEADLRASRSLGQALGDVVFGRPEVRSMLTPFAIAGDAAGERLFVCDSNAQLVHVFNLKTRRYAQWRPAKGHAAFAQPVGIAVDGRGRVLVSDPVAGAVYIFDGGGQGLGWIGHEHLTRPCGLAVDPQRDRIYIADSGAHQVVVLSSDGALVANIGERGSGPGEFNYPTYAAVDRDGRLYVSDSLNFRVQVFDADMKVAGQIGQRGNRPGHFSQPKGVAVDRHGHIYIIDAHFEAVQIFDRAGRLLLSVGEEGRGPGQFWLPAGIYVGPDDRIWIADSYNRRVQVLEYLHLPEAAETASQHAGAVEAQP
jgi:DNA-binding beta-propeller fold protein YncE